MLRLARVVVSLLTLTGFAGTSMAATTWLCGLSHDATQIVCIADADPIALEAEATTAQVRGTRFPLDPRGQWTVNFWSPATDLDAVASLARSTICFRSPGCEVVMAGNPRPVQRAMR